MTDIKMSNTFDLPVSDGDFTLVAMNKSTYVSMDRAAVIAINSYDLNQEHIAELEKENIEWEEWFDECYTELGKVRHELDKQVRSSGDRIAELEAMLAYWKRTTHVEMKNMPRITKEQEIEAGL